MARIEVELSVLLGGRRVDLRTAQDLSRYFRDEVVREAEVQYVAGMTASGSRHMVDACEAAARFAHGRSRGDLDSDEMLRFALVRAVEIVGEAAGAVSPEGKAALPVPWRWQIVGMRNRLVHAYFDINLDILWTDGGAGVAAHSWRNCSRSAEQD